MGEIVLEVPYLFCNGGSFASFSSFSVGVNSIDGNGNLKWISGG